MHLPANAPGWFRELGLPGVLKTAFHCASPWLFQVAVCCGWLLPRPRFRCLPLVGDADFVLLELLLVRSLMRFSSSVLKTL